jgi:putative tricarboxylic transport membrane protein
VTRRPESDRGRTPVPGSRPDREGRDERPGAAAADTFPGALARTDGLPSTDVDGDVPPLLTPEQEGATATGTVLALLLVTALGIGVAVVAPSYGLDVDGQRIGPGFLPLTAGIGLALLSLVQLASVLRASAAARRERGGHDAPRIDPHGEESIDVLGRTGARRKRNMRLVTVAVVLTVVLIPLIGFLESFALLLLFVSIVVERRPVLPAVVISVVAVAVVYTIFVVGLNVRLPMGALALLGLGT